MTSNTTSELTKLYPVLTPEVIGQLPPRVNFTALMELPAGTDVIGAIMRQLFEATWAKDENGQPIEPMIDRTNLVKSFSWAMTIVMLVVLSIRLHSRFWLTRMAGWEDYMTIPAAILSIVMHILTLDIVNSGVGRHAWTLSPEQTAHSTRGSWITNMIYVCCLIFMKISVLFQLLRISAPKSRTRKVLMFVFGASLASSVAMFLIILLQCQPMHFLWERIMMNPFDPATSKAGKCLPFTTVTYVIGALTIVMDLIIWITPMPMVFKLKVNKVQKIGLVFVFSISGVVCACAIGKLLATMALKEVDTSPVADFTQLVSIPIIWSILEANVAIIGPSLPTVRPLLKLALPSIFGSMNSTSGRLGGNSGYGKNSHNMSGHMQSNNMSQAGKSIPLKRQTRIPHPLDDYSSSTEELAMKESITIETKSHHGDDHAV